MSNLEFDEPLNESDFETNEFSFHPLFIYSGTHCISALYTGYSVAYTVLYPFF